MLNLGRDCDEKQTVSIVLKTLPPRLFISCKGIKSNYRADKSHNALASSPTGELSVRGRWTACAVRVEPEEGHTTCMLQLGTYMLGLIPRKPAKPQSEYHSIKKVLYSSETSVTWKTDYGNVPDERKPNRQDKETQYLMLEGPMPERGLQRTRSGKWAPWEYGW